MAQALTMPAARRAHCRNRALSRCVSVGVGSTNQLRNSRASACVTSTVNLIKLVMVVHTTDDIAEFSVTHFYIVGLVLGLIDPADMVAFDTAVTELRHSSDAGLE